MVDLCVCVSTLPLQVLSSTYSNDYCDLSFFICWRNPIHCRLGRTSSDVVRRDCNWLHIYTRHPSCNTLSGPAVGLLWHYDFILFLITQYDYILLSTSWLHPDGSRLRLTPFVLHIHSQVGIFLFYLNSYVLASWEHSFYPNQPAYRFIATFAPYTSKAWFLPDVFLVG